MAYKAAVFDLDGTLLNTIVDLAWATNYALEQFNMPTYTVDEVRQMVGNGVAKLIRDAVPEGTDDATYQGKQNAESPTKHRHHIRRCGCDRMHHSVHVPSAIHKTP